MNASARGAPSAARSRVEHDWATRPETPTVPWGHVLPLALVLSYANGFWIVTLRGALGAIERTSSPFAAWAGESTLLVPVYVAAVIVALSLALRWFGPRPRGLRAVGGTLALVVVAGTVTGALLLAASAAYDFTLQVAGLDHMSRVHPGCDPACLADRVQATLSLQVEGVLVGVVLMATTNLVLVGLVVALRGGRVVAATLRPARRPRVPYLRLLLVLCLAGAGLVHAAVVPEHLDDWAAAGVFFVLLALAQLAAAGAELSPPAWWVDLRLRVIAAVTIGPLVLWLVSRTAGLPVGPEHWTPEPVGVADVASCLLQLGALATAVLGRRRVAWSRHRASLAVVCVVAATVIGVGGSTLPGLGAFVGVGPGHQSDAVVGEPKP